MLAPVIPLKQDAALSPALVEALQCRLVLLHLLHHLGAQIHHRLVVADGQDQHVAPSQAALGHRQVALQRGATALSLSGGRVCGVLAALTLTCVPMLMTRCFST